MRTKTKYIHVNQHVIRANKKHNKNDPCITIKQGSKNTYCHEVEVLGPSNTNRDVLYEGPEKTTEQRWKAAFEWMERKRED